MNSAKDSLRQEALRHRDRIDPGSEDAEAAADHFFEALKPQAGQVVALYWPHGREFDTSGLIEKLLAAGVPCALPVVNKDSRELSFFLWDGQVPLSVGAFGIQEPPRSEAVDPDIVVVPLLAFDRKGHRLGYGGGYYDATLKALRARKAVTAVGIGYAQQAVLFNLPVDDHDQKLDWIITPARAQYFGD